jgi:hypothetical protein
VAKAKAKPKYSAAAFRRLVAKLAAKAEASDAARVEAQIKEICDLVSPGFGDRFIDLFRNQWRSREDANEYLLQRNRILVWLDEFAAARRKPYIEKARQEKVDRNAIRNKQMLDEYLRAKPSCDTKLMATIGERRRVKRTAAIEIINRGLEERGLRPAKPRKA